MGNSLQLPYEKNRGTVWDLTNQIAGFQIWTNQKAGFGTT